MRLMGKDGDMRVASRIPILLLLVLVTACGGAAGQSGQPFSSDAPCETARVVDYVDQPQDGEQTVLAALTRAATGAEAELTEAAARASANSGENESIQLQREAELAAAQARVEVYALLAGNVAMAESIPVGQDSVELDAVEAGLYRGSIRLVNEGEYWLIQEERLVLPPEICQAFAELSVPPSEQRTGEFPD